MWDGPGAGVFICGLAGNFFGALLLVVADDVRPELNDFGADDAFGRDCQTASNGVGRGSFGGGIVDVGDCGADEVPDEIGVVRSPASIVPAAPDGRGGRPERATRDGAGSMVRRSSRKSPF